MNSNLVAILFAIAGAFLGCVLAMMATILADRYGNCGNEYI